MQLTYLVEKKTISMSAYPIISRFPHAFGRKEIKTAAEDSMDTAQTCQVATAQNTWMVQKMTAHLQWQERGAIVIVYQIKAN
jgi:hypothetical protein